MNYKREYNMKKLMILILALLIYSCDKEVSVTVPEPDPDYGKLFVNSNPQGATIFLNGKNMGKVTPDTINWVPFGEYELKLRKKLFYEITELLYVEDTELISREIDYFKNDKVYGKFRIASLPVKGAEIIINGQKTNEVTPFVFDNMIPGEYTVKCFMPEFRSDSITFELSSEQMKFLYIDIDDTSKIVKFDQKITGKKINYVYKTRFDENDLLWGSTENGGMFFCDKKNIFNYNSSNSLLPDKGINDFIKDKNGKRWFVTGLGIITYHNNQWQKYDQSNSPLPTNGIYSIASDNEGNMWFGTDEGLVSLNNNQEWKVYNTSNSDLPANLVMALDCDEDGNVYIGTNGKGFAKFDGKNWNVYIKQTSNLLTDYINIVKVVDKNNILIGNLTEPGKGVVTEGGLSHFSNNDFTQLNTPKFSNKIYDINIIEEGIWISTGLCAFRMNMNFEIEKKIDKITHDHLPTNSIVTMDIDKNGDIWIGTWGYGFIKIK